MRVQQVLEILNAKGFRTILLCSEDVTASGDAKHFVLLKDEEVASNECIGFKPYSLNSTKGLEILSDYVSGKTVILHPTDAVTDLLRVEICDVTQSLLDKLKIHFRGEGISDIYYIGKSSDGKTTKYHYFLSASESVFKPASGNAVRFPLSSADAELILEEYLEGELYDFHPGEIMKKFTHTIK